MESDEESEEDIGKVYFTANFHKTLDSQIGIFCPFSDKNKLHFESGTEKETSTQKKIPSENENNEIDLKSLPPPPGPPASPSKKVKLLFLV